MFCVSRLNPNAVESDPRLAPTVPTVMAVGAAGSSAIAHASLLAIARQRRADHVKALVAARLNWRVHPRVLSMAIAMVLGSATLVLAYGTLLSPTSLPASAPALAAILLAATISSIAGFAFAAICGVILLHIMSDPVEVVQVMIVCSIAIQSLSVAVLWRDIDWRNLRSYIAGGAIGLPFGVWLLLHFGDVSFKEAVGGLLIAYAAYRLLDRPLAISSENKLADACIGFVGGITGGFAGFPGAAVTIWCGMKDWDKRRQRAMYQPFILIMQIMALLLIQLMRPSVPPGTGLGLDLLRFVPVALLGTWFGLVIFKRLSDRRFAQTVNLLLLVSGVGLLV